MSAQYAERLQELNITLPKLAAPLANYVPAVISGHILIISGQLPAGGVGEMTKGHLGKDVTLEEGNAAARQCAINIIAQARAALDGDLNRIVRCLRVGGFVASTPDFTDHPKVINGASDLIVEVFGDAGRHARAAVGVAALPLGAAVEVEAMFEIKLS
ncbi:MAG: RidA family protein [Alphaproteobacteria bacterium]|nr:RidA family protein [Alphaproteobacteria bacterium]